MCRPGATARRIQGWRVCGNGGLSVREGDTAAHGEVDPQHFNRRWQTHKGILGADVNSGLPAVMSMPILTNQKVEARLSCHRRVSAVFAGIPKEWSVTFCGT
jgi:hypothetical protein